MQAVPDVDDHISLAPVEYVADVVLRAAMQTQPPAARVFNVFGAAVAWRAVATALDTACGAPLRRLPLPAFVSLLDTAPGNALAPLRSYFARNNFPLLGEQCACRGWGCGDVRRVVYCLPQTMRRCAAAPIRRVCAAMRRCRPSPTRCWRAIWPICACATRNTNKHVDVNPMMRVTAPHRARGTR